MRKKRIRPYRAHDGGDMSREFALAAAVLTGAVEAWKRDCPVQRQRTIEERNACSGHAIECNCRECLRDWFTAHPEGQAGFLSFRLCAEAAGLSPAVILERLACDFAPRRSV